MIILNFILALILTYKLHEALKQSFNDMQKNLKGLDVQILKLLMTKVVLLIIFTMFTLLQHNSHNNTIAYNTRSPPAVPLVKDCSDFVT